MWYGEGGINAREGLVYNDPDDLSYDLEEEMQDVQYLSGKDKIAVNILYLLGDFFVDFI